MKKVALALALFVVASSVSADQHLLHDGLYVRSYQETPLAITAHGGAKVFLKGPSGRKILRCDIRSQNNANSQFYVSVQTPYVEVNSDDYVLVTSGVGYTSAGGGESKNEWSSIGFIVNGEENAQQIGRAFNSPVLRRTHPRHNLLVSFLPTAAEFSSRDEVVAILRIVNAGTVAIAFEKGGRNRATRDNQYLFSARYQGKQVDDIGSSYHLGGLSGTVVLHPGEAFEDRISLSKWFRFDRPGSYEVHGAYRLDFKQPNPEHPSFTIWEDYASADFLIAIR